MQASNAAFSARSEALIGSISRFLSLPAFTPLYVESTPCFDI